MKLKVVESSPGEFKSDTPDAFRDKLSLAAQEAFSQVFAENCGPHCVDIQKALSPDRGGEVRVLEELTELTTSHYRHRMKVLTAQIEALVKSAIAEGIE